MDVPDTDGVIQAKGTLERHMESLYQEALELANSFFEFTRAMNQNMDWPKKSSLQLRVRQRGLSLAAEWYDKKWYGSKAKGTRKVFKTYIAKPKGTTGYTLTKLLGFAQDWEVDLVTEVEQKLTGIRFEAGCVMKALAYLNSAMGKRPGESQ